MVRTWHPRSGIEPPISQSREVGVNDMVKLIRDKCDRYSPGDEAEFQEYRSRLRKLLDDALKDENDAVIMYTTMKELVQELGHGEMAIDVYDILEQERNHYQALKEIRRLLYGD